jgi:hypothetical protein
MKTILSKLGVAIIISVISWNSAMAEGTKKDSGGLDRKTSRQITQSVRKETKNLKKEGYSVEVGAPAIEWQLRKSYDKEFLLDEEGNNLFVIGVGSAISGIQNAARRHAVSDAQIDACTFLESKIMGLVENDYNNKLYSRNEYQTLSKMKGVFSNLLAHQLPVGNPVCTFVRDNKSFYEYQIRVAYSTKAMADKTKMVVSEILGSENDELRKKFERITGLDRLGISEPEK